MALVVELARGPGTGIAGKGPEERKRGMAPDRIEGIDKDVPEPVFPASK
jgi:hypothetical protein